MAAAEATVDAASEVAAGGLSLAVLARRMRHNIPVSTVNKSKIIAGVNAGFGWKILMTALIKNISVKNATIPKMLSKTMSSRGSCWDFLLGFWAFSCVIIDILSGGSSRLEIATGTDNHVI
ncbi:MAG: hypothetical protein Q4A82_00345 [Corynebacterium sp.]|nr:hypothetical protein [Corynebacterium sp.]